MLNEVFLQGRISEHVEEVEISGDRYVRFRLKVLREESGSDSINCLVQDKAQEKIVRLGIDAPNSFDISLAGRIQTRFFKVGGTVAAVTEVVVHDLVKI